jgi:xanthine/uracil/vitamin C permease (AzgA family)
LVFWWQHSPRWHFASRHNREAVASASQPIFTPTSKPLNWKLAPYRFAVLMVDFFDTLGTAAAVGEQAGVVDRTAA